MYFEKSRILQHLCIFLIFCFLNGQIVFAQPTVEATDDDVAISKNSTVTIDVLANDVCNNCNVVIVDQPAFGTALVNGSANVIYTPNLNYVGVDEFVYSIANNIGNVDEAKVTIYVGLEAISDYVEIEPQTIVTISPLDNDSYFNGMLSLSIVEGPTNGIAEVNGSEITYQHTTVPDLTGYDSLRYRITDDIIGDFSEAYIYIGGGIAFSRISGYVFKDENDNCIREVGETKIQNVKIQIQPGDMYAITNEEGYYDIIVKDAGTYTVTPLPINDNWSYDCFSSQEIQIINAGEIAENVDFPANALIECPVMELSLTNSILRRCETSYYQVTYCNEGTIDALNSYIEINLEEDLSLVDSDVDYTEDNGVYTFEIGDVAFGDCGQFYIETEVNCDAVLGSTVCTEAVIYPNEPCVEPSGEWDGSSLVLDGECLGTMMRFVLTNEGEAMEDSTKCRIFIDNVLSMDYKLKLGAGEQDIKDTLTMILNPMERDRSTKTR